MPELDELIDRLRADTADARWDDPATIRMRADRRDRRRRVAAAVAAVTVLLAGAGLVVALHRTWRPSGVVATRPASPTSAAVTPSATPSTTSVTPSTPPAGLIPTGALLTATDVASGATAGDVFDQPYAPNPFVNCGMDGYPHDFDQIAALGTSVNGSGRYATVGESVLAFRPGTAHAVLAGIEDLLARACRGHFTAIAHDLGGDESILLRGEDPEPGNAGSRQIAYHAIVRRGDRIAWVTVIDYATRANFAGYARTLASRAAQRMCAPSAC
jgi:hypothetical protein